MSKKIVFKALIACLISSPESYQLLDKFIEYLFGKDL
jgi:hypothetical protein